MKKTLSLAFATAFAAVVGCYTGPELDAASGSSTSPDAGPSAAAVRGLPCDVVDVLTRRCVSCHSDPPRKGALTSLTSREALMAPWEGSPSLAQASVDRMRDAASPMPPDALPPESEIAILSRWIEQGMPEGTCAAPTDPAPVPAQCTSGRFWTKDDDDGDVLMTPGRACISCHLEENAAHEKKHDDDDDDDDEAPVFTAAGTVYPTLREPDDCFGLGTLDAKVVIEGADGVKQTLSVNRAGNFMTELPIALPYRASVVRDGKTRAMKTAQKSGDCNTCHAANAVDAPGRILAP
ncbi:MAG: hypothetical protein KF819_00020 [Labilithrix sp.]|nr:hypothetical protein [Labilithrix sp.]